MFINIHDVAEHIGKENSQNVFNVLTRSTLSAVKMRAKKIYYRKGRAFEGFESIRHYDLEKAIAYCTENRGRLSNAETMLSICMSVKRKTLEKQKSKN